MCYAQNLFNNRELITEMVELNTLSNVHNSHPGLLDILKSAEFEKHGSISVSGHCGQLCTIYAFVCAEQLLLYKDYLLTCYPYMYINPSLFALNISEMLPDWPVDDYMDLFRYVHGHFAAVPFFFLAIVRPCGPPI